MNGEETLDDILSEMRGNEFDDPHFDRDGIIGARRLARGWADRIEAAVKRELPGCEKKALKQGALTVADVIEKLESYGRNTYSYAIGLTIEGLPVRSFMEKTAWELKDAWERERAHYLKEIENAAAGM